MFRVADLYCLLSSPNTTGVVKSGSMRWKGRYVASMRDNIMHTKFWLRIMHGKGH